VGEVSINARALKLMAKSLLNILCKQNVDLALYLLIFISNFDLICFCGWEIIL
jgi:hypothetical protein